MRHMERVSEAVMVAAFLQAEIGSSHTGGPMLRLLEEKGLSRRVIEAPDLQDPRENEQRAQLLDELRGYRRNVGVFQDMPPDVEWYRAYLDPEEWNRVMYIDYGFWTDFSGGSRFVRDAVGRLRRGEPPPEVVARFYRFAAVLQEGERFAEPILLCNPVTEEMVVLEGHNRITAYLLLPAALLREMPVLVGCSPHLKK